MGGSCYLNYDVVIAERSRGHCLLVWVLAVDDAEENREEEYEVKGSHAGNMVKGVRLL
jgi:hypothetical protein